MENRFYSTGDRYSRQEAFGCRRCADSAEVNIPNCINDDFCVPAPENMNGGILTMAFVDMQPLDSVYSPEVAFCNGTLFPCLNKPFYGGRSR